MFGMANKRTKTMKYWNGRNPLTNFGGESHAYICAFSKAEAVRKAKAAFGDFFSMNELNTYWSQIWGTASAAVLGEQLEPCVFVSIGADPRFFKFVGHYQERTRR